MELVPSLAIEFRELLRFASRLRQQGRDVENAEVIISVRDRGRWGEVRFIREPASPQP